MTTVEAANRIELLEAGVAQSVEHLLPKQRVVGSSPIARSRYDE